MRSIVVGFMIVMLLSGMGLAYAQTTAEPEIVTFAPTEGAVSRERLEAGEQLVQVAWEVINRPVDATLVFDQLMPNGTLVNVELPRPWNWVNAADSGVVAPVDPGEDETVVRLVLRVIDEATGQMLDYRLRELPIVSESDYLALIAVDEAARAAAAEAQMTPTHVPVSGTRPPASMGASTSGPVEVLDFHIYNEFPAYEDDVMLVWQVVNAAEVRVNGKAYPAYELPCCVSGSYNGGLTIPVADLVDGPGDWTIKMEARGADGTRASAAFLLSVRSGPLPSQPNAEILSFTISHATVGLNDSITLTWSTRNADTLTVSSSRGEGVIKSVPISDPQPDGSLTLAVSQLVNEPGTYWISLEAQSNRPGWAGAGYSVSLTVLGD